MKWDNCMTPPDVPVDKALWWICPCSCRRWFRQKSKVIADRLKAQDIERWGKEVYEKNTKI